MIEESERFWKLPAGPRGPAAYWPSWYVADQGWTVEVRAPKGLRPAHLAAGETLCGVRVPHELSDLARIVDQSRWMLQLEADWDGQGSPAYTREVWERAGALLLAGAVDYLQRHVTRVPTPAFENGPEGSIDILWETPERELLLNVPVHAGAPVKYYGTSRDGLQVKGEASLTEWRRWFPLLMQWLVG